MAKAYVGGAYVPDADYTCTGGIRRGLTLVTTTITSPTITSPTITGGSISATTDVSAVFEDRVVKTETFTVGGAALHAANLTAWTAPAAAIILRVIFNITTASTGASTIDIGYTATTATTTSDTLLDGVSGATIAIFDSMNAALDSGANALAQLAASGKWITMDEASGDTTGLVGVLYIQYFLV